MTNPRLGASALCLHKNCQAGDIDIDKIKCYGYKNIGFILDRGYFSGDNLSYMDSSGFSLIIMVKGIKDFISKTAFHSSKTFLYKEIAS